MASARNIPNEPTMVATQLNNLADLLSSKGDYDGAEPLFREAIAIFKNVLGNDHPLVATGFNNLAGLLSSKGDYDGAEKLVQEALLIDENALGHEHPDTITDRAWLGSLLQSQGNTKMHYRFCKRSLKLEREFKGLLIHQLRPRSTTLLRC